MPSILLSDREAAFLDGHVWVLMCIAFLWSCSHHHPRFCSYRRWFLLISHALFLFVYSLFILYFLFKQNSQCHWQYCEGHNIESNKSTEFWLTISAANKFHFDMVLGKKEHLKRSVMGAYSRTLNTWPLRVDK